MPVALLIPLVIVAAYLLGSIPSAVWIGRRFYGIDIREHGSRNAGATNTLRVLGRRAALPVFAIDIAKGFAAVMLVRLLPSADADAGFWMRIALAVSVVAGHIFPVFAGFRGGKGVATMTGAVLAIYPPAVLLCIATFFIVLLATHYVSLGSIMAGVMLPVYMRLVFGERHTPMIVFGCVVAAALIVTHRRNIARLVRGTESKIYLFPKKN